MRKRLWSMVLCLALSVSLLSGCGKKAETGSGGSPADTERALESQDAPEEGAAPESDGEYDFGQDKTFNMTAGGIQSAEDTVTLAMQKMAEIAEEKSGGTIKITVSPAGQLGDATSQMEAVSLGTQEIFVDASSWLSTFVDDALVTSMFFLIRDE